MIYSINLTSNCSNLKNTLYVLNELLDSDSLSPLAYEIALLELMRSEAQLEECEEKDTPPDKELSKVKKRSISF